MNKVHIEKYTLKFLSDLEKNNYREWFNDNKTRYETARDNVLAVASALFAEINKFDKNIIFTDPKKSMFRIYRDVRFSKDKAPYKTNMGVMFSPDGSKKCTISSYYMHVMPKNCFVSCGIYMPYPEQTKALRLSIEEDFDAFSKIVDNKKFVKDFGSLYRADEALSRVPTGFDKNSPAANYLKMKSFYVFKTFSDSDVCGTDFVDKAADAIKTAKPLQYWLNRAVEDV